MLGLELRKDWDLGEVCRDWEVKAKIMWGSYIDGEKRELGKSSENHSIRGSMKEGRL